MIESHDKEQTGRSRWIRLVIFLAAVAVLIWWTFRIPYDPVKMYRAVPAEALAFGIHEDLPGDLTVLSKTGILKDPADQLDIDIETLADLLSSIADRTIGETIVSYIPSLDGTGQPAWLSASWIGRASIYLRWMLFLGRVPGFTRVADFAGWSVWGFDEPVTDSGMRLSVATGDGILFACVSQLPAGVINALAAHEGLRPSLPIDDRIFDKAELSANTRGIIRTDAGMTASYHVARFDPEEAVIYVRAHVRIPEQTPLINLSDFEFPARLLGDLPAMIAASPLEAVATLSKNAADVLSADEHSALIIALLTGEHGGRMPLGIPVPALLAMSKTGEDDPSSYMLGIIDRLNAEYQTGLIVNPTPITIGRYEIRTLEAISDNFLSALNPRDGIAFAKCGDWLVLCSSARALSRLLTRVQNPETVFTRGAWQKHIEDDQAAAMIWMDTEVCGRELKLPLLLWSRQAGGRDSTFPAAAQKWIEEARRLKSIALALQPDTFEPIIRIEIKM